MYLLNKLFRSAVYDNTLDLRDISLYDCFTAAAAAEEYGATGWVRNEADESVSMELQGTEKQIRSVLGAIEGNSYIRIDRVESKPLAVIKKQRGFEVKL